MRPRRLRMQKAGQASAKGKTAKRSMLKKAQQNVQQATKAGQKIRLAIETRQPLDPQSFAFAASHFRQNKTVKRKLLNNPGAATMLAKQFAGTKHRKYFANIAKQANAIKKPEPFPKQPISKEAFAKKMIAKREARGTQDLKVWKLAATAIGFSVAMGPAAGIPLSAVTVVKMLESRSMIVKLENKLAEDPKTAKYISEQAKGTKYENFFRKIAEKAEKRENKRAKKVKKRAERKKKIRAMGNKFAAKAKGTKLQILVDRMIAKDKAKKERKARIAGHMPFVKRMSPAVRNILRQRQEFDKIDKGKKNKFYA